MVAYRIWYHEKNYLHKDSNENKIIYTTEVKEAATFSGLGQLSKFLDKIGLRDSINKRYDPIYY